MEKLMVDTDVLIDVIKGRYALPTNRPLFISIITLYEVVRGSKDPETAKAVLEDVFTVLPLDNRVVLKASQIYRHLKSVGGLPNEADILIGSTAIVWEIPLLTRNVKHFKPMEEFGLKIEEVKVNGDKEEGHFQV